MNLEEATPDDSLRVISFTGLETIYDKEDVVDGLNHFRIMVGFGGVAVELDLYIPTWVIKMNLTMNYDDIDAYHRDEFSSIDISTGPRTLRGQNRPWTIGDMLWVANCSVFQEVLQRNSGTFKLYFKAPNLVDVSSFTVYSLDILPEAEGDITRSFLPDLADDIEQVIALVDISRMDFVGVRIYERAIKYFENHQNSKDNLSINGYAVLHALLLYHHVKHPVWIDSLKNLCLINIALVTAVYVLPAARAGAMQRNADLLNPSAYQALDHLVSAFCPENIDSLLEDDD